MWKKVIGWIAVAAAALLLAAGVRLCWVSIVEIPGDGGQPVFLPGDRVAVNKVAYGLRLWPVEWWGYVRLGARGVPLGEGMAFNDPSAPDSLLPDERPVFVGYCYAVPGDSLWVDRRGQVYRRRPADGRECRRVELPRKDAYVSVTPDNIHWYCRVINLHEGAHAEIIADSLCVEGHFVSSFRFTHDYYWVSAASPRGGADSRTFGFVPDTHVIGRLARVVYSWDAGAPWYARWRFRRTMMKVGREEP